LKLESLRLYEGLDKIIPESERKYLKTFDAKKTRFIWIEFKAENLVKDKKSWACEVFFNFRTESGEHKGRDEQFKFMKSNNRTITFTGGWGNDKGGSWYDGKYYLEVSFMETMLARLPFYVGDIEEEATDEDYMESITTQKVIPSEENEDQIEKKYKSAVKELDELIGLEQIKDRIKEYTDYMKFLKFRKEKGLDDNKKLNLHAVFTGNPGTGKTTVARLLGKIYKQIGLLSKGHVHEVDREDLVGKFIGHTAPKVKDAIRKARGGILFIDEAYSLARIKNDSKDYGREVIEIIVKEMSDGKGDLAIIVAGYPAEMNTFLESNPGIKSRFTMHYDFPDYTPQELQDIAEYFSKKSNIVLDPDSKKLLYEEIVEAYRNRDRTFGNARFVISVVGEAKMKMGIRLMRISKLDSLSNEELSTVKLEDMEKVFEGRGKKVADIPVDEDLLRDSLLKLHILIDLEDIKAEIDEMIKLVRYYREEGRDVREVFSLHAVFTGNPGTGKTTVARIMADLYKALGIIERGHLVECDRQKLVSGYVGQTAIKTAGMLDKAMGGVLFIDEAYALTQGGENDFGKEAVETILKTMEDRRGEFIVITAGYPDNMKQFLESNPGLKSRFDKFFEFKDFSAEELHQIAEIMFGEQGLKLDKEASDHLMEYLKILDAGRDKYFGNARAVRRIVEEASKNHHLRIIEIPKSDRKGKKLKTITIDDIAEFKLDKGQEKPKIGFSVT
jgi:SpoVK/Ycf46/Vps4 family AAA+-type ATPase